MRSLVSGLIVLVILAMPSFAKAEGKSEKGISGKQPIEFKETKERQTREFTETKEVVVRGPGDFSHVTQTGETNFRLGPGETHTIKVQPGDKLHKEPATKP